MEEYYFRKEYKMKKFNFTDYMKYCFFNGHRKNYTSDFKESYCVNCGSKHPDRYQIGEFLEQLFYVLCALLILGIIILGLYSLTSIGSREVCREFAQQNGLEYIYKFISGCYVNYNGHWVSPENLIQLFK